MSKYHSYTVRVHAKTVYSYEIDALDSDHAADLAYEQCMNEEAPDEILDIKVSLTDYPDLEELQDREDER